MIICSLQSEQVFSIVLSVCVSDLSKRNPTESAGLPVGWMVDRKK